MPIIKFLYDVHMLRDGTVERVDELDYESKPGWCHYTNLLGVTKLQVTTWQRDSRFAIQRANDIRTNLIGTGQWPENMEDLQ